GKGRGARAGGRAGQELAAGNGLRGRLGDGGLFGRDRGLLVVHAVFLPGILALLRLAFEGDAQRLEGRIAHRYGWLMLIPAAARWQPPCAAAFPRRAPSAQRDQEQQEQEGGEGKGRAPGAPRGREEALG